MSEFQSNLPINILPFAKNVNKGAKEAKTQASQNPNPTDQIANNIQQNQTKTGQSIVNTNSNIVINQPTQTSPGVTQAALNAVNPSQTITSQQNTKEINVQIHSTPSQVEFKGADDLPAYAGIANMSFKSWITGQENKSFANLESGEKQLTVTLDGIKGFQKQNYEDSEGDGSSKNKDSRNVRLSRNKNLIILSQIFSSLEQSHLTETELLVNIHTFKKLGSSLKDNDFSQNKSFDELKLSPPFPDEPQKSGTLNSSQVKYLHQLLALPSEFPECLRLFARDRIELNPKELNSFLKQRLHLIQDQIIEGDKVINQTVSGFVPLLNQNDYSVLLPLVLLYYPLPLPNIKDNFDFLNEWKKKKKEEDSSLTQVIASCEIYYLSKMRGRFLLKFELNNKQNFSFDIQTAEINNGIVRDLENAISEIMFLLETPPLLTDLNVLLTKEIYKATDIDEELSIVSHGPLRLEIVLAVYSALVVLNRLNEEPDPRGIIEM